MCLLQFWPDSVTGNGRIWPKLSKGTSKGQDLAFEPIHRSLRPFVAERQPGKAHVSKTAILDILAKGTSTGQDLSYEPILRSLRPFVTKLQPGKESMTDGRTDRRTPRIYRLQPLGLGPNKRRKAKRICPKELNP